MEQCHVRVARLGRKRWTWSIDGIAVRRGRWQGTAASKELADFAVDMVLTALATEPLDATAAKAG
jgi:hypothetical protein